MSPDDGAVYDREGRNANALPAEDLSVHPPAATRLVSGALRYVRYRATPGRQRPGDDALDDLGLSL